MLLIIEFDLHSQIARLRSGSREFDGERSATHLQRHANTDADQHLIPDECRRARVGFDSVQQAAANCL